MEKAARLMISIIAVLIFLAAGHVSAENIKIGYDLPLTGDSAFIGAGVRDATIMGKEAMGKTKHNYELIYEDGKYDPKLDATVGNKFVSMDKVDIMVSIGGGSGGVLAPLADQYGLIHFAMTSMPSVTEGDLNFAHWTPTDSLCSLLSEEIKKRGFKRPAVFINIDLNDLVPIYDDLKNRVNFVAKGDIRKGQTEFRTEIAKIKQANPDIIVILAKLPEMDILIKQIKEQGLENVKLTSTEILELAKERPLLEGEFYVGSATPTAKFREEFKARYGRDLTIGSSQAYDVIQLIITATEKVNGKPTPKLIAAELMKIKDFPGVLGKLNFRADGRVLSNPNVRMFKDGKVVITEQSN